MKDKKTYISALLITTVMLFSGGCGKQAEPVSAELAETVKEVDTGKNTQENSEESTEASLEAIPSPTAQPEEGMEGSDAPDNPEKEDDTAEKESSQDLEEQDLEYEIISVDDTVMYATSNCNIRSGAGTQYDKIGSLSYAQEVTIIGKVEADEDKLWYVIKTEDGSTQMVSASMLSETKPAAHTSSGNGSGSSSNSGGSTGDTGNSEPAQPAPSATTQPAPTPEPAQPTPTPEPVHTHDWKEHTATTQTWIPNIVVVDDYETVYTESYEFVCNICDFDTTDRDAIANHQYDTYHSFNIWTHLGEEQVKVGSHEEDQGHYETSTYVDYYYCDCGETKN